MANNQTLQAELEKVARAQNIPFFRAQPQHTGDNAGMIAFAAWAERRSRWRERGRPRPHDRAKPAFSPRVGRIFSAEPRLVREDPPCLFSFSRKYGAVGLRFTLSRPTSSPW